MTEQWTRWEPISGLAAKHYIESMFDGIDGFKIVLSGADDETKRVQIVFKDSVLAYRSTYEGFKVNIFSDLSKRYGTNFYAQWSFFKVNNSNYLQWVLEQAGTTDSLSCMHFCVFSSEAIVDIIATYEPIVELI